MTFETIAPSLSLPMRTLRARVDRAPIVVVLPTIGATTLAIHPGSTGKTFPVVAAGER